MIATVSITMLAALAASPDIGVLAKLTATKLRPAREYTVVVSLDLPGGFGTDKAGVPAPLLQLEIPDCIQLSGKHLTTYKELSRNEFLEKPYERLLEKTTEKIHFKLLHKPGPDDAINLNIIAYVADSSGDNMQFIRKRLTLPIRPGAIATPVEPTNSQWGTHDLLQIGSEATDFTLPTLTGGSATLSQFRGKKNVLVTTYRAHW